jgi:hypothetical protein
VVEVEANGLVWIKSSTSNDHGTDCVEMAAVPDRVLVRCSRDRSKSVLSHPAEAWQQLIRSVRNGD